MKTKTQFLVSLILLLTFLGFTQKTFAAEPVFSGGSNVAGLSGTRVAITDLQVIGESNPNIDIRLYVPSGTLSMDTVTGLTFVDNIQTGSSLYFSGSLNDVNAALATLHFESVSTGSFQLEATITPAGAIFYPGNDHVYEVVVLEDPISANDAKIAANTRLFGDIPGYLATITSQEENDYISARLTDNGWIAASDALDEGDWKWIDGPEEGASFWSGAENGFTVNGQYANWNSGEPNNSGDNENCAEFIAGVGQKWNDLPCGDDFGNPRYSYIVEYGGEVGNPAVAFKSLTVTLVGENSFDGGFGTVEDPFRISTCLQLQDMKDYLSSHFELVTDINCGEGAPEGNDTRLWNPNESEWVDGVVGGQLIPDSYSTDLDTDVVVTNNGYSGFIPVGDSESAFTGSLDGNGYTIIGLWIFRKNTDDIGLFGQISSSTIQRVNIVDSNIVGSDNTGALVGYAYSNSIIENVILQNNMVRAYLAYNGGGLSGYVYESQVSNIVNTGGTVHGSGSVIGGIIGNLDTSILNNATSSANVDGGYSVGGLIGSMGSSTTTNSVATGNVRTDRSEYIFIKTGFAAGGFVGNAVYSIIENSHATGNVESSGDQSGGFAGNVYGVDIRNSYSTGNVTGLNSTVGEDNYVSNLIGGFIGRVDGESLIENTYATGDVSTQGDSVGGFTGISDCSVVIRNSYATGNAVGNDNVGGFVGSSSCEGPSTNFSVVFSEGNVRGNNYVGGFAGYLSTADVINAYTSAITVIGNEYVGGFAGGMNYTDVDNVYSRANVIASGEAFIGGFVGSNYNDGVPVDGIWNNTVESQLNSCGNAGGVDCDGITATTTLAMSTTRSTFENLGYDFELVWTMSPLNNGYPYFFDMIPSEGFTQILSYGELSNITQNSVTLNANILNGQFNSYGFFIGTQSHEDSEIPVMITNEDFGTLISLYPINNGDGSLDSVETPFNYSFNFQELSCGTTYYYRAGVFSGMYEIYDYEIGSEQSFTTSACDIQNSTSTPTTPTPNPTAYFSPGSSSGLTTQQLQKIFGPNAGRDNVIGVPTVQTVATTINSSLFTRNLGTNIAGNDVKELQKFLNSKGFIVTKAGAGSIGKETTKFGPATRKALINFQKANNIKPASGYFGPLTRAKVLELLKVK